MVDKELDAIKREIDRTEKALESVELRAGHLVLDRILVRYVWSAINSAKVILVAAREGLLFRTIGKRVARRIVGRGVGLVLRRLFR